MFLKTFQVTLVVLIFSLSCSANDPVVNPNSVGLSGTRLQVIDQIIQDAIDAGNIPMGAAFVARHGKVAYNKSFGYADVENQQPLQPNALFRIASMSKLVTSIAAMICYEQGKFSMEDPISKFIPAFANSTVAEVSGNSFTTRAASREIQVRDVLTHKAGMLYQPFAEAPLSAYYLQEGVALAFPFTQAETLESYVNRYATAPMVTDPGVAITYGAATDVLGRLVEVWSGQSLADFIQAQILTPLDMDDTHFFIPPGSPDAARVAKVYTSTPLGSNSGSFVARTEDDATAHVSGPQMLYSGASGLLSTPQDYFHLAQMILDHGKYNNQQILSRKAIEMMTADQLGGVEFPPLLQQLGNTTGFGVGIRTTRGSTDGLESLGTLSFGGGYWTRFWIDPKEDFIVITLTQSFNLTWDGFTEKVKNAAFQAIVGK